MQRWDRDVNLPSTTVRDLGIYIDADLNMWCVCRVQRTVARCFAILRQLTILRSVKHGH